MVKPTSPPVTPTRSRPTSEWLSAHRVHLVIVGVALLLVGVAVGFAVTAAGSRSTGELSLDVAISHHRDAVLTAVAQFVNVALGPKVAPVLLLLAFGFSWFRSRFVALTVVGLTIIGWLSVEIGKAVVGRARPPASTVHALASELAHDSYPSGHTAFAAAAVFAVIAALLITGRRVGWAWAIGLPLVAVVAASRLYLGVHYLTDVAASVIFAGGSVLVAVGAVAPFLLRLRDHDETRRAG